MKKYVTVNAQGAASGSVWHVHEGCSAQAQSTLREVTDTEITLLGVTQCRACLRYERLMSDDVVVHLSQALKDIGLEAFFECDRANAAKNLHRALDARGVQLIIEPRGDDE